MRYVSFSGGADSTALAIYLKEQGEPFELVFADTGAELPETYSFISHAAHRLGVPMRILSNGTLFQHLHNQNYYLPGPQGGRWCTRLLKLRPIQAFISRQSVQFTMWTPDVVVSVGIRADEPDRMDPLTSDPGYPVERPLVDAGIDKDEALRLCRSRDMLNPVYEWRTSCSCFCCPFQRKDDWMGLLKHHPHLFELAERLEAHPSRSTSKPFFWRSHPLGVFRSDDPAEIEAVPECREEACVICQK